MIKIASQEFKLNKLNIKAKSKEELEEKFNGGELEFGEGDIIEENMIENSLEIEEVE